MSELKEIIGKLQKGDYNDYWKETIHERELQKYYDRLYEEYKDDLASFPSKSKIIDIGGGSGQFLEYLGIKQACILDISESGIADAKKRGYDTVLADARKRFPINENSFDVAYCFEFFEHMHHPTKTLVEINNILKNNGILFIGQPNTKRIPGHVRRIYIKELVSDLKKSGFEVEWVKYIPGFNKWDITLKRVLYQAQLKRKILKALAWFLTLIPYPIRSFLARKMPNRFAMIYIVKCRKVIK